MHLLQSKHKVLHRTVQGRSQNGIVHNIRAPKVVSEPDPVSGHYNPFPAYTYTGPIKPVYPLSPRRFVPKSIKCPDWSETGIPKAEKKLSRTKWHLLDSEGQEAMRKVCRLAREVLDLTAAAVKPGVTTDYLDEVCHNACIERDVSVEPAPSAWY